LSSGFTQRLADQRAQIEGCALEQTVDESTRAHVAEAVVQGLFAHQQAAVAVVHHPFPHCFLGIEYVQPYDIAPAGHDRAHGPIRQPKDLLDHVSLGRVNRTLICALFDQRVDFLVGHQCSCKRPHSEYAQDCFRADLEERHDRVHRARQRRDCRSHRASDSFGIDQRDSLRHELAQYERQAREHDHDTAERQWLGDALFDAGVD
jgi:hypothetical protein